ncbi:hypothetical protein K439DRAFT_1619960 [Ramaria rubella]|nr:hypothetical protein K439DRAFT_1619960 [Ramaria rubella]
MRSEEFGLPADVGVAKTCGSGKGMWGGVRVPLGPTRGNCFHLHVCWGHTVVAADACDTGGYKSVWGMVQGHKGVWGWLGTIAVFICTHFGVAPWWLQMPGMQGGTGAHERGREGTRTHRGVVGGHWGQLGVHTCWVHVAAADAGDTGGYKSLGEGMSVARCPCSSAATGAAPLLVHWSEAASGSTDTHFLWYVSDEK